MASIYKRGRIITLISCTIHFVLNTIGLSLCDEVRYCQYVGLEDMAEISAFVERESIPV
jgi:hypothetical protein